MLVVAVKYFFRVEVENYPELSQFLTSAKLESISDEQRKSMESLRSILTNYQERFDGLFTELLRTGQATLKVGEANLTVSKATDKKVDAVPEKTAALVEERIRHVLSELDVQHREVRSNDSRWLPNDNKRLQALTTSVDDIRRLSVEERRKLPPNDMGKMRFMVGDFDEAYEAFHLAANDATAPKDLRAEAFFNAYQTALELKKLDRALEDLRHAVELDGARFAPFPFDRFEATHILGRSGFGVVFRAHHAILKNKRLVVKSLLTTDLDRTPAQLFQEAQLLASLEHESIIRLLDCGYAGTNNTRPYLVTDYFDGMNLENYVKTEGTLLPKDLLEVASKVAEALRAAHQQNILHRDVTPENILVKSDGQQWRVKLIDFGLALQKNLLEAGVTTLGDHSDSVMTKTILAGQSYSAPELKDSSIQVGSHTDVFGFGKSCYYALFMVPEPDNWDKDTLPPGWKDFLERCTARKLEHRLRNFDEVLAELAQLRNGTDKSSSDAPRRGSITRNRVSTGTQFELRIKDKRAWGCQTDSGFLVYAGSQASKDTKPTLGHVPRIVELRQELIRQKLLFENGGALELSRDYTFESANVAASLLLGLHADGRGRWKDPKTKKTLRQLENDAEKQPEMKAEPPPMVQVRPPAGLAPVPSSSAAQQAPSDGARDGKRMDPTIISCPSCSRQLKVTAAVLGKKLKCPLCKSVFATPIS